MNMNDFTDEMIEQGKGATKRVIGQIVGSPVGNPKVNEFTGKPIPSKKILTKISREADQLALARLKKTRENLDKMKLQRSENKSLAEIQKEKKVDNIVDQTLKNAQSTGEIKGGLG